MSRRAVLKGMGVTVALPFLDAMAPAGRAGRARHPPRCGWPASRWCTASAGSTAYGLSKNLWSPAAVGRQFDLSPTSLAPLEPFRDYITIVSNTDVRNAEAFLRAGNRRRSFPVVARCSSRRRIRNRRRARTSAPGCRSISSTRSGSGRTRRFRRCSCASRTSIRPAAANTAIRVHTPTRSAGRRRTSRCR